MNNIPEIKIRYFIIDPQDIVYLKAVLESYEGMVVVRTVEAGKPVIELLIAHDFQDTVSVVIEDLKKQVKLEELPSPDAWTPDGP